jgi:hypothetical protein
MSVFTDFDASYGSGCYSGMPTGDGGTDVFHDGSVVNHIHHKIGAAFEDGNFVVRSANQAGGVDTVVDGQLVSHTQSNVLGGMDVYHDGHLAETSMPNALGGEDIYGEDMQLKGMTTPNVFGSEDYLSWGGNENSIMQYDDPLQYASKLRMRAFDAGM